uniref:Uncharacterized protein n=1 Tax=Salarias fasciatus TaxID=181472 RepID=A0A672I0X6_SALFA
EAGCLHGRNPHARLEPRPSRPSHSNTKPQQAHTHTHDTNSISAQSRKWTVTFHRFSSHSPLGEACSFTGTDVGQAAQGSDLDTCRARVPFTFRPSSSPDAKLGARSADDLHLENWDRREESKRHKEAKENVTSLEVEMRTAIFLVS